MLRMTKGNGTDRQQISFGRNQVKQCGLVRLQGIGIFAVYRSLRGLAAIDPSPGFT